MNTTTDPNTTSQNQQEYRMETFPQPRTIPDGWDLSEMLNASEPNSSGDAASYTMDDSSWNNR